MRRTALTECAEQAEDKRQHVFVTNYGKAKGS